MLQGIIVRGTTPTHDFELPYSKELIKNIRVSYGQNGQEIINKNINQCKINNNILSIDLTQEETFSFVPGKKVVIEIRIQLPDKKVVRNEDVIELRVVDTINNEVLD